MDILREWAFSICAAMVACGIALQIMPKTNLAGIFKLVVSVFFLCCLLSPLILRFPYQRIELEEYSSMLAEEKAENLKRVVESQTQLDVKLRAQKIIADKLAQMGIKYHDITININTNGQSEGVDSVDIILDKSHEPEHEKIVVRLESALLMDVRLDYAEKE